MHPFVRRACGALAGSALLLGASAVLADNLQTVHVVLAPRRGLDNASNDGRFDKALPSGEPFRVEVSIKDLPRRVDGEAFGTLDVWPKLATGNKCKLTGDDDIPQHHKLALIASGEGDNVVLKAEVPALQIGQEFCFLFDVRARPSAATVQQIASLAAEALVDDVLADCTTASTDDAFAKALNKGIEAVKLEKEVKPESASRAHVRFQLEGSEACRAAAKLAKDEDAQGDEIERLGGEHDKLVKNLATLDVPEGLQVPMFADAGFLVPIDRLLVKNVDPNKLAAALQQLKVRISDPAYLDQKTIHQGWIRLLEDFRDALAKADADKAAVDKAVADAKAEAKKLPAPELPEVFLVDKFIPLRAILEAAKKPDGMPDGFKPLPIAGQIRDMEQAYKDDKKIAQLELWVKNLRDIASVEKSLEEARKERKETHAKAIAARKELTKKLVDAMNIADVRHDIEQNVGHVDTEYKLGRAKTPPVGNIAAIDVGAALAIPIDAATQPWLVPYTGINFYFTPIDRVIPVGQLVGSWFLQHVSLTVGITLTAPTLPGRTLKPIMFERYPLIGAGIRWNNYSRVSLGTIMYQIADRNPASTDTDLGFAPFLSGSFDGDVIDLLNKAIKK
ncbi:hypothetical protein [Polyangium sp. 6x1]|uniref:hypothetical protein n=1 Tax=Polyangium sp. 6x1 TaxID=3042689 RepID=UPI00248217AC|nr:hypothetical protein [Polyangium sp. 6x1]MDI1442475.1 hypothetical protein [Polyangium sp. 6x1]